MQRNISKDQGRSKERNITDEASKDSFPASDPPSWTPMTGVQSSNLELSRGEPTVGEQAPNFIARDIDGRYHSLADFLGETVVLTFAMNPADLEASEELSRKLEYDFPDSKVITLYAGTDGEALNDVENVDQLVLVDKDQSISKQFGFTGCTYLVIGPDGTVAACGRDHDRMKIFHALRKSKDVRLLH